MPRNKDLKRLVRVRMKKTGEAYTAARAQIIKKSKSVSGPRLAPSPDRATVGPKPAEYVKLAGMNDDTIKQKTGKTWAGWVDVLDGHSAATMTHREIAALVNTKYEIDGWWSQTVTVGYERIKGLRARGQRRDGTYEANKSRTYDVPVRTLFDAWANVSVRERWLDDASVKVRTAAAPKSMRLGWADRTIVAVGFMPKGRSKSAVAVQHTKLPDRATAERLKHYWSERLDALGEVLARH